MFEHSATRTRFAALREEPDTALFAEKVKRSTSNTKQVKRSTSRFWQAFRGSPDLDKHRSLGHGAARQTSLWHSQGLALRRSEAFSNVSGISEPSGFNFLPTTLLAHASPPRFSCGFLLHAEGSDSPSPALLDADWDVCGAGSAQYEPQPDTTRRLAKFVHLQIRVRLDKPRGVSAKFGSHLASQE